MKIAFTRNVLIGIWILLIFSGNKCQRNPDPMVSIHDPIYPDSRETVTYTLLNIPSAQVDSVSLFHEITTIRLGGGYTVGPEKKLKTWKTVNNTISYTTSNGYGPNKLVFYKFQIFLKNHTTRNHNIAFAIRPFPISRMPIPVYVQVHPEDGLDLVFIPEADVDNLSEFRDNAKKMITEAFQKENTLKRYSKRLNFYLNPFGGIVVDAEWAELVENNWEGEVDPIYHTPPINYPQIQFAEGKGITHKNEDNRDLAGPDGLFSCPYDYIGVMLHEIGHAWFKLSDEYGNDGGYYEVSSWPNVWSDRGILEGQLSNYDDCEKNESDISQLPNTSKFKLCSESCLMELSGKNLSHFDCPCKRRIEYSINNLND